MSHEDVAELFDRACQALLHNRFVEAENSFAEILTAGTHPAVHHNLALAVELQGRFDEALLKYRTNTEAFPEHVHSFLGLANCHRYLGEYEEAEISLKRAIAVDPEDCRPHILLSELWFFTGTHDYNDQAIDAHLFSMRLANSSDSKQSTHYAQAYYCNGDGAQRYHMFAEGSLLSLGIEAVTEKLRQQLIGIEPGPVVAMLCNAGYLELTQNCLMSRRVANIRDRVLVFCLDEMAYELQKDFPEVTCIPLYDIVPLRCIPSFYNSQMFNRIVATKCLVVATLLEMEMTVLFCDADVVWLKPALDSIVAHMVQDNQELCLQVECESEDGPTYCTGFFVAFATPANRCLFDPAHQPPMCGGSSQ